MTKETMVTITLTKLGRELSTTRLKTLLITKSTTERLKKQIGIDDKPARPTPAVRLVGASLMRKLQGIGKPQRRGGRGVI